MIEHFRIKVNIISTVVKDFITMVCQKIQGDLDQDITWNIDK